MGCILAAQIMGQGYADIVHPEKYNLNNLQQTCDKDARLV
jgi:hypothetical protein